jgi:DMSO/TMAO reductase YedYZ molybdopterin-dependent catalytic subunit
MWAGVKLRTLIENAGITTPSVELSFGAADGYSVQGFPMTEVTRDDVIIAYELDGTALSETVRLVVPGANGNVWIAMIDRITVTQSSSQASPVLPQSTPFPFSGGLLVEDPSTNQLSLPKQNETIQEQPEKQPEIIPQQPVQEQPTQPTEQEPPASQSTAEEPKAIPEYGKTLIAFSAILLASTAAFAFYLKKTKQKG